MEKKKKVSFINAFLLLFFGVLTSRGPGQTNLGSTPVSSNRFFFSPLRRTHTIRASYLMGTSELLRRGKAAVAWSWLLVAICCRDYGTVSALPSTRFCPSLLCRRNLQEKVTPSPKHQIWLYLTFPVCILNLVQVNFSLRYRLIWGPG